MLKFTSHLKSAAALALVACSGFMARRASAQTFDTILNTNLFQPSSVSVSPLNHYVISDTADHRIVDFNADNRNFIVLAGPESAPFEAGAVDGQRIDARFRNPQGVLCAGDVIYVADSGNHVLRRIDKDGNVVTIAGDIQAAHEVDDFGGSPTNFGLADGTGANVKFNGPAGLAWDGSNHLYVADSGNHAIRVLDLTSGAVSTLVRSGLTTPVGIAIGANGTLFISDTGAHSIKIWHPGDTKATLLAGGGSALARGFRNSAIATNALFNAPAGLFYREVSDELIVADSGNSVLRTVQGASGTTPKVDTFANTTAAGFKSPVAVTRDIYGVFLVCDPTRNTLASVLTVRFPRIDRPQVGYIEIVLDPQTQLPEARLVPVSDSTFDNYVRIAISGDASAQHYFTVSSTLTNTPNLEVPTTNSTSAPNFVQPVEPAPPDNILNAVSINGVYPPKYNFHLKVFSAPKGDDERIASLVNEAYFRFKCASPQIDSQSIPGRLVFHCNTTNAVMYYTLDGSEPDRSSPSSHIVKNNDSISLIVTINSVTVRARAYADDHFIQSDTTQVTFTPDNFVPNRISLGFADGEASSYMRAAAGQRFFAPVTLSLMPGAKAYGLQFDLSLEPLSAPPLTSDYKMRFNSSFIEQADFTNYIIPPSVFVLTGTNYVTNRVDKILTNYTYEATFTNSASVPTTNYVMFTNELPHVVPVVTTVLATNLGTTFAIPVTNYVTNSFQLVSSGATTNTSADIETNYLYRYVSSSVTNFVRVDAELEPTTPVVITNLVSNLGQLYSYNVTNYVTNSFNLLSAGTVTNVALTVTTNYAYQAVSPAVTNYLSLSQPVPPDADVIVTNFVSNLGQQFPITTTNHLTNSFDFVSSSITTNTTTSVDLLYQYRAITPGVTNLVVLDHGLPDSTPLILTNFVTNLGQLFPVLSTNYITNDFNLVFAGSVTNKTRSVQTNFLYEAATPSQTNFVVLDHGLEDATEIITTNLVSNMGQQFPVLTTNRISNAFNLLSIQVLTNNVLSIATNFDYRAVTPGTTNYITASAKLPDSTQIILTNFVTNMGQLYPLTSTNYISNAFNLVSLKVESNGVLGTVTNYLYAVNTPGQTNVILTDHRLSDQTQIVTTNLVSNLGEQFPVLTTNTINNNFNLLSEQVVTNIDTTVTTNFAYRLVIPGKTNLITVNTLLQGTVPVITTNLVSNLGQQFPVAETNYLTNAFDLVTSSITTNVVSNVSTSFLYRSISTASTNYVTVDHFFPDPGPVVTAITATNLGQTYVLTQTNIVPKAFEFVSATITTNVINKLSYDYSYGDIPWENDLRWPDPLPADATVVMTNLIIITNQATGIASSFPVVTSNSLANATASLVLVDDQIQYRYQIPTTLPASTLISATPLVFPPLIAIQDNGFIPELNQTYTHQYVTGVTNSIINTNTVTNRVFTVQISTNAIYRLRSIIQTNYIALSTNLPDVAPVVSQVTITNQGQNFTFSVTNFASNVFDLVSTTYSTNVTTNVLTNAVYALKTPAVTNIINLSTNLPDSAEIVTTSFVTNFGQLFPVRTTNIVANSFEFLGATESTNTQATVRTNVTYLLIDPPVTNYVIWPDQLPGFDVVLTTNFVSNLGRLFPIIVTNYVTNNFRLVGPLVQTNYAPGLTTNALYAFATPSVTNFLSLTNKLLDLAPVVTTTFLTNQGQVFPINSTNYLANTFDFLGEEHLTNVARTVNTNFTYVFLQPAVTNYIMWPTRLPDVAPVITTNFVSNLGQLFPVAVTNYLTNTFRLVADGFTSTNESSTVTTEVVYQFSTPNTTNYVYLAEKLPASRTIITTNFISNLGQQYPVLSTNIVLNTFELLSTNFFTNVTSTLNSSLIYALKTPSVTNIVMWPVKLPDFVSIVSTNFITNLGALFPVLSTNIVGNEFQLLFTNFATNIALNIQTNVLYEFHTPAVTNLFELDEKLPSLVQVITTNFVTNLGRLFPVLTTNLAENVFDLLSTNVTTNITVEVTPSYLYSVITPGAGGDGQFGIVTNLLTMDSQLPRVTPIVTLVGFATNLTQLYPIYATNYVTNTFRLVSTNLSTNSFSVSQTNVPDAFTDLVITNYSQNWLAVGWVEVKGRTNLYNTLKQDLLSLSMPNTTTFVGINGEAVPGSFSFVIPTNAATGDQYKVAVSRPSATADGISQDMFIEAPGDEDTKSPVKAVKTLNVTNQVGYLVGDVSNFRWFNAGEFGDTNLLNNDITLLQRVIVYGLNVPPEDSDYLDAMDTCCFTEDGTDLSNIEFGSSAIDINRIAFGEGSRYAPLGRRPNATLAVNDLYVAFRRSTDPSLNLYYRYWSNGMRQATIIPNVFRPETSGATASSSQIKALSIPSGSIAQSALTVYAGTASGMPGNVVAVPIHARVDGSYPLRTLMFNAHVEMADGTIVGGSSLDIKPTDALGLPTVLLNDDPARAGVAWLSASGAGILGDQIVGQLLFTIPQNAQPSSLFYVKLERISGSPNGISLFPVRSGNGIIAMANRGTLVWNDGIPDAWRLQHFGTLNDPRSAADVDADGDGLSNYEEYKLGTDPLDPSDSLRVHAASNGRGVKIRFHTASGKMYRIEGSTNLDPGAWTTVLTDVAGTGNDIELPAPGGAHSYYYRVLLQD